MRIRKPLTPMAHPSGHLLRSSQSLLVVTVRVHIQVAGEDLVKRVVWRPHAVALAQPIEKLFWKGAQVSVPKLLLTLRQLHNQFITFLPECVVAVAAYASAQAER